MVRDKSRPEAVDEATRSAFRHYQISQTLTPKIEALVIGLDLIDVKSSSIRCQGRCVNGGKCSQRINQQAVMRAVLQLQTYAIDLGVVGNELEVRLGWVYEELLCGSARHLTDAQKARCVSKAKPIVEAWRERWPGGSIMSVELEDCKKCVQFETKLVEAQQELVGVCEERDRLREEFVALNKDHEATVRRNNEFQSQIDRLAQQCSVAEEEAVELDAQLQALQIQHDDMVGRIASEVEQQQNQTPRTSASRRRTRTPTGFLTPLQPVKSGGAAPWSNKESPTPSTRKPVSPLAHRLANQPTGAIGIGNTKEVSQHGRPSRSIPTPEATPEKQRDDMASTGDVLFTSGPLQTSGSKGLRGEGSPKAKAPAPFGFTVMKDS